MVPRPEPNDVRSERADETIEPTVAGPMPRALELVPGTMVGEYEITGVIGSGGVGAVYSAIHPRIGKHAAIKILQRKYADDPSELVRFENEAKAVNEIRHPNIVDIFAFDNLPDGSPYFVMEQVEGVSLQSWLEGRGRLPLEQALPILDQIFDALAAAHERGVVHRDLKPGNIMLGGTDAAPRVKVLDFGLAKRVRAEHTRQSDQLTTPGVMMGTPLYMSPEQFLGQDIDHRTDVYSLGVLVYVMLCGRYPFRGSTPVETGMMHVTERPPLPSSLVPSLPAGVDQVVLTALAKNPNERYASVRDMRAALARCQGVAPVEMPSAPRGRTAIIAIGFAAAAAIGAVTFMAVRQEKSTPPSEPPAAEAPPTVKQMPVVTPPAPPAPTPPAQEPAPPPAPPPVETKAVVESPPTAEATVKPARPTGRKIRKRPKTPPGNATGSGSAATKPPCDPYKTLDGCP